MALPTSLLGLGLGVMLLAAPLVGLGLAFGTMEDGHTSNSHARDAAVIPVSVGLALGGLFMTGYGASKISEIRRARKLVAQFDGAGASLGPGQLRLNLRFRF
jgi:hypothetical protein